MLFPILKSPGSSRRAKNSEVGFIKSGQRQKSWLDSIHY